MQQKVKKTTAQAQTGDSSEQMATLQQQLATLTDIAGRAQADLQNAKARLERDAEDMRKFASESLIRKLLPTIDNFQRAFQHLPPDLAGHEWVKGVSAIEQEFIRQLSDLGLKKIESVGRPFNPSQHEVLLQGAGAQGVVLEVFEDGYELHGKVLRPAKVKVGDGSVAS